MIKMSVTTNSYYIMRQDKMPQPNPRQRQRIKFIKQLHAKTPSNCPECNTLLEVDDEQIYCPECGLVTQDSIAYVAGFKIIYPHGLRLG